jgi:hypothetical protein
VLKRREAQAGDLVPVSIILLSPLPLFDGPGRPADLAVLVSHGSKILTSSWLEVVLLGQARTKPSEPTQFSKSSVSTLDHILTWAKVVNWRQTTSMQDKHTDKRETNKYEVSPEPKYSIISHEIGVSGRLGK